MVTPLPKRNWKIVFFVNIEPVRGRFKGQFIQRRYVFGQLTAASAWRRYGDLRVRPNILRLELWCGRRLLIVKEA